MVNLDDLLTSAESAPVPSRVVRVCVNPEVARQRAVLLTDLEDAQRDDAREASTDERLSAPAPVVDTRTKKARAALKRHDRKTADALITLRFERLPGNEWALLTTAFPIRVDVALDRHYGYNYDAVSEAAARRSGVILTDDGQQAITGEQWDRMFRVLAGHDVEQIRDAVWTLNEYEPEQHVAALVKGFGAA